MSTEFDKRPITVNMDNSGLVKILQDNLDKYPENTVLRELLQNADDAGATFMAVIHSPSARNKLLNPVMECAKLIIVNDGPVTQEQLQKMFAVRAGWQIGDNTKIGKFGYGMKSIFHWCDFGWVMQFVPNQNWSTNFVKAFGAPNLNLDVLRNDTDDQIVCNDVRTKIVNHVTSGTNPLFVLVLALRDEQVNKHLSASCGYEPLKIGPFLTSEFVEQSHDHLSRCLPCLSDLSRIITIVASTKIESTIIVENQYTGSDSRLKRLPERKVRHFKSSGYLHTNKNGAWIGKQPYALNAIELSVPELTQITQSDDWPKEPVSIANVPTMVPEKAVHTGGVLFIGNGTNHVNLLHATYLPLQSVIVSTALENQYGFDILLHGTFHSDSSRKEVIDIATPGIRSRWNSALFCHVISPLVLSSVSDHLNHLLPKATVDQKDLIWILIKEYIDKSKHIFGDENFTKTKQLVFRVDHKCDNKYEVIDSSKSVVYLPETIIKNYKSFRNFTAFTDHHVCTVDSELCLLRDTVNEDIAVLSSLGFQSTTSLETLNSICDELAEDKKFTFKAKDNIEVAKVIREVSLRTQIPSISSISKSVRNRCNVVYIPERLSHYFVRLYRHLVTFFEQNTIFCRTLTESSFSEANGLNAYNHLLNYISNGQFLDSDKSLHALKIDLIREKTRIYPHTIGLPVKNLNTNDIHLRTWKDTYELYRQGYVTFSNIDNKRLSDQIILLNPEVNYSIEHLTRDCLDDLAFNLDCTIDEFIIRLNQIPFLSSCKQARINAMTSILDVYDKYANKIELDRVLLRLAHTSNQKNWIAIATEATSPLIVELLRGLGHTVVSERDAIRLIDGCFPILKQFAMSYPDNFCVRIIRSEVIRTAIMEAGESVTRRLVISDVKATKNELIRSNMQLVALSKLPLAVSHRGFNFARSWSNSGIVELSNNLRIPIVSQSFEELFLGLRLDFIRVDGNLIKEKDVAPSDLLLRHIVENYFAKKTWTTETSSTLHNVLEFFSAREKLAISKIGEILRKSLLSKHLYGTTTVRVGKCPHIFVQAMVSVFNVRIFDGTPIPLLNDICQFHSDLFDVLVPEVTNSWLCDFLLDSRNLDDWNRYWILANNHVTQPERQRLSEWILGAPIDEHSFELFGQLPIHKTWHGLYTSKCESTLPVACCHYTWLPHVKSSNDFMLQSKIAPTTDLSEGQLFTYLCTDNVHADLNVLGPVIGENLIDFTTLLENADVIDSMSKLPFIEMDGRYYSVHEFLIPASETYALDLELADILNLRTKMPIYVQRLAIYKNTRIPLRDRILLAQERLSIDPDSFALGEYEYEMEDIVRICVNVDKPKHRTMRFIKAILDNEALIWVDKEEHVTKVIQATSQFRYKALVTLTYDLVNAGLDEKTITKTIIKDLTTTENRTTRNDFCVPTVVGKWQSARTTLVHGFNAPNNNLLLPSYGNEISCNLELPRIPDISEYFEHDVWADYQSLKSATLAMLGMTELSINIAESGMPTGYQTKDLTRDFNRLKLLNVEFYARHMSAKTRMQYCDGHFDEITTAPDQLRSLVDHVDTTENQTKVYLVLPTQEVEPNKLRSLLLDLAPTIYRELGMDSEECLRRLKRLSDDGQTTITETQQIALSRFQTTLQMIGQSRMPKPLQDFADELTSQQLRLTRYQRNMLERHQQANGVRLEDHEIGLIDQNKQTQDQLVSLLESDVSIHQQSIEAIRDATTRYSYDKLSFAFELIQNADDALEQLKDLDDFPNGDVETVVDISTGAFILAHPGRRINYYQNLKRSIQIPKFKNDLVYMLTLNLTDKSDVEDSSKDHRQYHQVTGKYGLGFKSVYQVTDDVKITSGELAAEFRCGIWPMRLDNESRTRLDAWRAIRGIPKTSTVIQLGGVTEVPRDFIDALVLLPLSTRNIRTIKYIDSNGNETSYKCKVQKLAEHVNIIETTSCRTFLQVVGTDQYTWQCFEIKNGMPVSVKDISNYWVTVPTRVNYKPGFVCNAKFPLNSARTAVEHNDFMYGPFCSNFAAVMSPAYRSLFQYLGNSKLKPSLGLNVAATLRSAAAEFRSGIEEILKRDNRLFEFLGLDGLPANHQELAISSLSNYMTLRQTTHALANLDTNASATSQVESSEHQEDKAKNRPTESSIAKLFSQLNAVSEDWHIDMDSVLYGDQMPKHWFNFITEFQTESDSAREVWHRLILRSTFESVGVLRNASSCSSLLSAPYMKESIRLSRIKQGGSLLTESTEFMRKLVWDEHNTYTMDSGFYSGEIMKAAILASELEEVVEHIDLSLRDFSLVKYQNPRSHQGRHILKGAIGSKASFFLLREVLRCFSRSNHWSQKLDKASNYAYVVTDPLARELGIEQGDDNQRAQMINLLIDKHCSVAAHAVGFDLQIRQKLGCL